MRAMITMGLWLWASVGQAQVLTRPPANLRDVAVPVLEQTARDYPEAWACAHVESRACKADWIKLAAARLHAFDPRFGLNGKRGNPNDLSLDVITYLLDPSNPRMVAAWDVCGGCGAAGARVTWGEITNYATIGQPGTAIWLQPPNVPDPVTPPPPPPPTTVDLAPVLAALKALEARLDAVDAKVEAASREALNAAIRALEIKATVEALPREIPPVTVTIPCFSGRVPKAFGGSSDVTLCPKVP